MGYESSAERWSPVQSVEKILLSVVSMLAGMRKDSIHKDSGEDKTQITRFFYNILSPKLFNLDEWLGLSNVRHYEELI